jgi:hypothetical protein
MNNRFDVLSKCNSEFVKLYLTDSTKFKHVMNENISESEMIDQCIFFLLDNRNRIIRKLYKKNEKKMMELNKMVMEFNQKEKELKIANIKNTILLSIIFSHFAFSAILFYIRNYEYI